MQFIERHLWNGRGGVRKLAANRCKIIDPNERTIKFVVSTAARDRDGDIVEPSGWKLDAYMRNPVVLWAHDSGQPPIAKALSAEVVDGMLMATAQFPDADTYAFADTVFKLYAGGYLSAVSAGFMPSAAEPFEEDGVKGYRITEQELWEFSAVPIPANPEALVSAKAAGLDIRPVRLWLEKALDEGEARPFRDVMSGAYIKLAGTVHRSVQADLARHNLKIIGASRSKSEPKPLYIRRPVLNGEEIAKWAKSNGFRQTLEPGEMHVTLAYSKSPVDWSKIVPDTSEMVVEGGEREVKPLGDKGAVVLRIEADALSKRWKSLCEAGCSWDYAGYQPHVTLAYSGGPDDMPAEAYKGPIRLGGEIMEPLDEDWSDKVQHQKADDINPDAGPADDNENAGQVFTTGEGGDPLHTHEFAIGDSQTTEAGDPPHVHAVRVADDGTVTVEDAEGHGHEVPAEAKAQPDPTAVPPTDPEKEADPAAEVIDEEGKAEFTPCADCAAPTVCAAAGACYSAVASAKSARAKDGRVLSKGNMERLREARDRIDEVLAAAQREEVTEEKSKVGVIKIVGMEQKKTVTITPEIVSQLGDMIAKAVETEFRRSAGRVR